MAVGAKMLGSGRMTVADWTTEQLRTMIISGELADGAPLKQDALAATLGVSRIPVREALARLERDGLAASFPHRGYVVTGLSRSEIEELFGLRILLEPELIGAAIPRMSPADLDAVAATLEAYNAAIDRTDAASLGEQNIRYHMALYAPADRRRTLEIVRGLLVNTDRYARLVLTLQAGVEHARAEHTELLELCRQKAVSQAVTLTRNHIERARANLLELLEREPHKLTGREK